MDNETKEQLATLYERSVRVDRRVDVVSARVKALAEELAAAKERHLDNAKFLHELKIRTEPTAGPEADSVIAPASSDTAARNRLMLLEDTFSKLVGIVLPGTYQTDVVTLVEMVKSLKSSDTLGLGKNPFLQRIQKAVMPYYQGADPPALETLAAKVEMWVNAHHGLRKSMDELVKILGPRAALNPGEHCANIVERVRELKRFQERTQEELQELDEE